METTDGGGGSANAKPGADQVRLDAEAKALKLEQTKAESRKAIAEAEQAIAEAHQKTLLAKVPTSDIKPLDGKIDTGEKSGLPADILAHSLVTSAAEHIAKATEEKLGADARVLVVEDRNLAKIDWPYQAVRRQLTQQKRSVKAALQLIERQAGVLPLRRPLELDVLESLQRFTGTAAAALGVIPALGPLVSAGPAAVGAIAAVAAMFHSDYSITSRDSTITTTPLLSAVAAALLGPKREVTIAGFHLVRESAITTDFWDTWNRRVKLEQFKLQIGTRDIAPVEQEIADLQKHLDAAVAEHEQVLGTTGPAKTRIDALARLQREIGGIQDDDSDETRSNRQQEGGSCCRRRGNSTLRRLRHRDHERGQRRKLPAASRRGHPGTTPLRRANDLR